MRFATFILALLLVSGHTAGLQLVAWSGMFIERVSTAPTLMEAVASAVDGTRPCALCRAVAALQHDRQDDSQHPAALKVTKKPEIATVYGRLLPVPALCVVSRLGAEQRRFADDEVLDVELPPPQRV